ncbi:MAG: rhomboid family intramembrane serine protease [Muribaculaceae bacterium]|nr:rhomboid family intramembrane serine protease [Muribaculaceae bacterium]
MTGRNSFFSSIPMVTKNLLIINVLMWIATIVLGRQDIDLIEWLGLHFWRASDFNAAQLVTYMFMHDNTTFTHLFFNMFSLWMFGVTLERVLGAKRYLFFYLACGLGAALVQELVWEVTWKDMFIPLIANQNNLTFAEVEQLMNNGQLGGVIGQFWDMLVTVGASGAVFGILLAFGMIFPNLPMYIIPFPFPIKAKWMVIGYGAIELFFGVTGSMDNVAHFAHLGGMLFAFIIIYVWKKKGLIGNGLF